MVVWAGCGCASVTKTRANVHNAKYIIFMASRNFKKRPSGSNEPKVVGEILDAILRSDSRFATAYRKYKEAIAEDKEESDTNQLFETIFPNTELGIDLKLFTLKPGRINEGEFLAGMLTRDGADRYCFVQNASKKKRVVNPRNPQLYKGTCINVNQQTDGSLYVSFNRPHFTEDYTFKHFCLKAADELLMVAGLVGEE